MKNGNIFHILSIALAAASVIGCSLPEEAPTVSYYTITFDKNDLAAAGVMPKQMIESGKTENILLNDFSKNGWAFSGWAASADGTVEYINQDLYTMGNGNVTLYAKWTQNYKTITFLKNDADADGTMEPQNIACSTSNNLNANTFTKTNWTFIGWATTASAAVSYADRESYFMGNDNVTLYATWIKNNTIVFDKNDIGATGSTSSQTVPGGTSVSLTSCGFIKTGWTFSGWALSPTGAVSYANRAAFTIGANDVILYAKWKKPAVFILRDRGPAGGWIFYDKGSYSNGWRYLECAPANLTKRNWGTENTTTNASGTAIGTGKQNTIFIIQNDIAVNKAADECDAYSMTNGGETYADWFLPSKDELNQMYVNLYTYNIGEFSSYIYFSSSENDAFWIWAQRFSDNTQLLTNKGALFDIRAVRAF